MSSEVAVEMYRSRWKRYPAYRESGVEWIGEVPEEWEINNLNRIAEIKGRIGWRGYTVSDLRDKDDGVLVIGATQIDVNGNIDLSKPTYLSHEKYEESPEIKLEGFELLLVKVGATIGKVGYVPYNFEKATINPNVMIVRNSNLSQKFLFYFLRSPYVQIEMEVSKSAGAQDAINQDFVGSLMIAYPSSPEQCAIAAFLDRETGRIDTLIEKKERQIELLQEKRAALISHAVTKGLEPDVKMKDSGVEWLGEVPEHWSINRAKLLFQEINDRSTTGDETLLTVSHITGVTRRSEKNVNMFMAESLEGYKICKAGDLVINTMWAWMGAMGIAPERGIVSPSYNVYRFRSKDNESSFYDYLFRTGQFVSEVICHSKGVWSSRLRLYPKSFFEIQIQFPPQEEQRGIVSLIQKETGSYETLQRKIEKSIEKLHEYRTALISAAVTGKIDVRQEVA